MLECKLELCVPNNVNPNQNLKFFHLYPYDHVSSWKLESRVEVFRLPKTHFMNPIKAGRAKIAKVEDHLA